LWPRILFAGWWNAIYLAGWRLSLQVRYISYRKCPKLVGMSRQAPR
jgi:hypothetical protein